MSFRLTAPAAARTVLSSPRRSPCWPFSRLRWSRRRPSRAASTPRDYVVGAVGDISGDHPPLNSTQRNKYDSVAALAAAQDLDRLLLCGDLQHNFGTLDEYLAFFAPVWSGLNPIAAPVVGNHDYYKSPTAEGFFTYFGQLASPRLSFEMPPWATTRSTGALAHRRAELTAARVTVGQQCLVERTLLGPRHAGVRGATGLAADRIWRRTTACTCWLSGTTR